MKRGALALAGLMLMTACTPAGVAPAWRAFGDPANGKTVMTNAQCGACHQIPGVVGADGHVGPPLAGFGARTVIAGVLPNTPANLVRWLRAPQSVKPGDAMPNTGLSDLQARDIAAYLDDTRPGWR